MNKEKVFIQDLVPGMFVYELDRPWLDTPFLLQGFLIESPEQIEELGRYCQYVYIDPLKSSHTSAPAKRSLPPLAVTAEQKDFKSAIRQKTVYEDKATVEAELGEAKAICTNVIELVSNIQAEIQKGQVLDAERIKGAVADMVDSVIRNPDALLLHTSLKEKDPMAYGRSIDIAICILAFGRHLGFSRDELQSLGLGGLLLDVGKIRLPKELLAKRGMLSAEEHRLMKSHVHHSVDILSRTPGITPDVVEMVATHHEREDGSGYPRGLKGEEIGVYGQMAAIADCFRDLTSERRHGPPVPPYEALQLLHQWRGRFFQEDLVQEFIQCIGIYPVGSLVELNTGEVAVVVAHNRTRRHKPRIKIILDPKKRPYPEPKMVDLNAPDTGSESREIRRGLEFGMYGLNPQA